MNKKDTEWIDRLVQKIEQVLRGELMNYCNQQNQETSLIGTSLKCGNQLGELALQLCDWFNRRPTTKWSDKEIKAFRQFKPTDDELSLLERRFTASPQSRPYRRKDLLTLLNNWQTEVDRERQEGKIKPVHWSEENPEFDIVEHDI